MTEPYPDDHEDPVLEKLQALNEQPRRDPEAAARTRSAYLAQVNDLVRHRTTGYGALAQETGFWARVARGMQAYFSPRSPAQALALALLLVVFLLAGSTLAVAAAGASLPGDPLYRVKLFGEDLQRQLRTDPQSQISLALEFAGRRVEEMAALQEKGATIPPELPARLRAELNTALLQISWLPDEQMQAGLEAFAETAERRQRDLEQIHTGVESGPSAPLQAASSVLQEKIQLARAGEQDPTWFRRQGASGFHGPLPGMETMPVSTPPPAERTPQQPEQVTPSPSGQPGVPSESQNPTGAGSTGGEKGTQGPGEGPHKTNSQTPSGTGSGKSHGTPEGPRHQSPAPGG